MSEQPVQVGDILYGFCGGYFGDSYDNKVVIGVGSDWVTVRELDHPHTVLLARGSGVSLELAEYKTEPQI